VLYLGRGKKERGRAQEGRASDPQGSTPKGEGNTERQGPRMCLAIPGQIVEIVDEENRLARVDVAGVRRNVNIGLLDADDGGGGVEPGDWVLIHVGFALSQVDEEEALETRRLLEQMGAEYEQELEELKTSVIE
jgi:hydrogenase expression/formation protein HypC